MALDLDQVSSFMVSQAGNVVRELVDPGPELLRRAQDLYVLHNGRLPSPPPPAPIQPSKR